MSDEKVFFEDRDVTVTASRFLTYGKTQALSGITAVSSFVQKPNRKHIISYSLKAHQEPVTP